MGTFSGSPSSGGTDLLYEEAIGRRSEEDVQKVYDGERGDILNIPHDEDGEEILVSEVGKKI